MQIAPFPANEAARLAALRALLILDTPPEERFDRIVQFAAAEFDTPMAVISLVDTNRQWFKARVGVDVCSTERDIAFCAHALAGRDLLIVEDAALDPRFAANPLVTGDPFIRFYAGAPLALPCGSVLGTLCVLDTKPRKLCEIESAILHTLRDLVLGELTHECAPATLPAPGAGDVLAATDAMPRIGADGLLARDGATGAAHGARA
jgi:GAF domain-containing protein